MIFSFIPFFKMLVRTPQTDLKSTNHQYKKHYIHLHNTNLDKSDLFKVLGLYLSLQLGLYFL